MLENKHVITQSQVWISVLGKGPSNGSLNSSFSKRDTPTYKSELGHAIINFASVVPDGMLVFFASYSTLSACISYWQADDVGESSIWYFSLQASTVSHSDTFTRHRMARVKHLVVEPRDSSKFAATRVEFEEKLEGAS